MKKLLLIIALSCLGAAYGLHVTALYQEVKAQQALAAECLRDLIQAGIERRDIQVSNGTCVVILEANSTQDLDAN